MKNINLLVIVLISPHTLQQYEKTLLVFSRPDDVRKSNSDFFHNAYHHCTVVVARCPSLVVGQARESVSVAAAAGGAAQGPTRKRDARAGSRRHGIDISRQ